MSKNDQQKSITKYGGSVPTQINIQPGITIDISWMPEDERMALLKEYVENTLDINKKAQALKLDADMLKRTLDDLVNTTNQLSQSGNAVTITHVTKTENSRTELITGNTEQAMSGKLTKSQTGEKDWTPYYIFAGILALIIIAALVSK